MRSCSVWPEEWKTATLIKISITGSMLTFRSSSRLTIAPGAEWEFCGERRTGGRPLTGLDPFPPWNFRKEIWCGVITMLPISQLYKSKHLLKWAAITWWKSTKLSDTWLTFNTQMTKRRVIHTKLYSHQNNRWSWALGRKTFLKGKKKKKKVWTQSLFCECTSLFPC